jgi:hypothetical protein
MIQAGHFSHAALHLGRTLLLVELLKIPFEFDMEERFAGAQVEARNFEIALHCNTSSSLS